MAATRIAAALIALSVGIPAAGPAQTVDEIVEKHIAARGGRERLAAIETLKFTRTIATAFTDYKVVVYKKRPQFFRVEQQSSAPGAPVSVRGVSPGGAWDPAPGGTIGMRPAPLAAEALDLDADFDGWLVDWKQKGHTVTLAGREAIAGRDTYKLAVTLKSGLARTVYLDAETYLDRRHTGLLNLPGGRQFEVTIDFGNWRDVNGVKFPFDITEERTGKEPVQSLVTYTESIEMNVPMDDRLFAPPKS